MRLALQIFTTLFLVSLLLGGLLMSAIDFKRAEDLEVVQSNPFGRLALGLSQEDLGSPSDWRTSGYLWVIAGLSAIVGIAATYVKKPMFGIVAATVAGIFLLIALFLQPSVESAANNPKVTAYGITFFSILGVGLLVLLHTVFKVKPATN